MVGGGGDGDGDGEVDWFLGILFSGHRRQWLNGGWVWRRCSG